MTAQDNSGAIPSWVVRGQRVVCIDDSPSEDGIACPLVNGTVYVIAKVWPRLWNVTEQWTDVGIDLVGEGDDLPDRSFWLRRFRPAVPPKTKAEDIAMFTHLLSGTPVDA